MAEASMNREQRNAYFAAIRQGLSSRAAAAEAGVGYWVPFRLSQRDRGFQRRYLAARERAGAIEGDRQAKQQAALAALQAEVNGVLGKVVTFAEAGRRLGVSKQSVQQRVDSGRLPCIDTPFGRLVPADALEAGA